jgi:hypothetical protein
MLVNLRASALDTEVPHDRYWLDVTGLGHLWPANRCFVGRSALRRAKLDPAIEALEELLALLIRCALDPQQVDNVILHDVDPYTANGYSPTCMRTYVRSS